MNKKKIIILIVFIIAIIVMISIYHQRNIKIENNAEQLNEMEPSFIEQTIKNQVIQNIEEKPTENIINENINQEVEEQEEIINTKEKTEKEKNKENNSVTKNTESSDVKETTSTKSEEKNTEKTETITVESVGEYDIKNGGTAIYTESIEIPKEWLDY